MFRVLIAVALIQHNLGKPLEDGLLIPHDVEMIPVEEHGHHIITTASLERISIEDNDIPLNDDYEGEIGDDNNNIPRPERAIDTAPCSAGVDETDKSVICKDESIKTEHLETTEHQNFETNEDHEINESLEINEGKDTNDDVESNEGKETNKSVVTNESVETNEVVLLNQTIRMNSSAIADGKLKIILNFEVLDDETVEVVSSEIVDPADVSKDAGVSDDDDGIVYFSGPVHAHGKVCVAAHYGCGDDDAVEVASKIVHAGDVSKDNNDTFDDDDDIVHFSGPVHAQGKVCVSAHYGCGDDHVVKEDSSEIVHPGDVSKDSNETVNDEDDDEEEDDDNVHFCGPIHAQGNVCVGAHYGCGGPPISMCFSRPCGHGQQFSHPTSENDHDFEEDEDDERDFAHYQYRCPNIACQYYPSGTCSLCRSPEYHHQDHFGHHHDHFDHSQNHFFDHHQNHDFEQYFRVLDNSDYDSGEDDDYPRLLPVSGYVPASGSVKIAAQY